MSEEDIFERLEDALEVSVASIYFQEPRVFKSLMCVLDVVVKSEYKDLASVRAHKQERRESMQEMLQDRNAAYLDLLKQQDIVRRCIEDVIKYQGGGLNNSVDTMGYVISNYSEARDKVTALRSSLIEIQEVLSPKKTIGKVVT